MEHTIPLVMDVDIAFTIGEASDPPLVDGEYQAPFPFTGKLNGVTITVAPPVLSEEDKKSSRPPSARRGTERPAGG